MTIMIHKRDSANQNNNQESNASIKNQYQATRSSTQIPKFFTY